MASLSFHFGLFLSIILPFSSAYNFNVGGKNGWTLNPSEDYNHWAERNRFQVNDTLTFRYKKGADSVLVVKKDDYYKCNTNDPIVKFDSGTSVFKFDRSGPFFFISGNQQNCQKGQRLIIVVLAVRPPKSPSAPPPPGAVSPANSPSSTVSPSPESNSPSPAANSPQSNSPSPSSFLPPSPAANSPESSSTPTEAPSPAANAPESSSSPSPAANSPGPSSPSPAASSPGSSSPAGAPGISRAAGTPEGSLAPEPASDSGETADVNSPAPTKSGSPAVTASKRMMETAVVAVILGFVVV